MPSLNNSQCLILCITYTRIIAYNPFLYPPPLPFDWAVPLSHCDAMHSGRHFQQPSLDLRKGITPDQTDPQRRSTMSRKMISTFTAAAMSMSIAFAVPVAVTAVSCLTVVPEAQASVFKSINKAAKSTVRVVKKRGKTSKKSVKAPLRPAEFIILRIR
jgi:hypothetical protein